MATKPKTRKVATRKNSDGSQQWESQKYRKDALDFAGPSKAIRGIKDETKRLKAAKTDGKAKGTAFGKIQSYRLAAQSQGRNALSRTKKKPMGGK